MKNVILIFLLVGLVVSLSAQSIVKFKPIGLDYQRASVSVPFFGTVTASSSAWDMGLGFEYGLNKTLSLNTTLNFAFYSGTMMSFTPEVRAYLTGSEAVTGFYVGGYGGLAIYTGGGSSTAGMAGASLGFQKTIGDRITMDVGPGIGGQFVGGNSIFNIRPGVTLGYMLY
ncbi:MAG: hypothetical protein VXX18_00095 [Bacteroidota bacterium]|nr:hypothetical protein [Bacteroidota bacterium]